MADFKDQNKGEVLCPKHGDFFWVAQDIVLSHCAKFQLIINFFRVCMYFVVFLPDYIACFVTKDPNRSNLKIKQNNFYFYRDTGEFNFDWFKLDLQEAIEAFLNTNELASSD